MAEKPEIPAKSLFAFAGHFGSGKTENALNFCRYLAKNGVTTSIIDLDMTNPYFRSMELEDELNQAGIKTIFPNKNMKYADFPTLMPAAKSAVKSPVGKVVVDLGGESEGVLPLGSYAPYISINEYDFWLVVNANRIKAIEVDNVLQLAKTIEATARLKFTGIVNNTHMKEETTVNDILYGLDFCAEISLEKDIPLIYSAVPNFLIDDVSKDDRVWGKVLPLTLFQTLPWEWYG